LRAGAGAAGASPNSYWFLLQRVLRPLQLRVDLLRLQADVQVLGKGHGERPTSLPSNGEHALQSEVSCAWL
jgi:hypothetical protein